MKTKVIVTTIILLLISFDSSFCQDKNEVFTVVKTSPEFPGGVAAMFKFLSENINYPADAKMQKIEGRVHVTFIVQQDGVIDTASVELVEGLFPSCDEEAIRVVKLFPRWSPGLTSYNEPAKVRMVLPVFFMSPKEKKVKKRKKSKTD